MCGDQYVRIITKYRQGVPTIPVSADHRNGDWLDTDIYEGEQYMDTDTGLVYTRWINDIVVVGKSQQISTKHILVSQTGTNAPTNTIIEDNIGGGVWAYVGVGIYTYTNAGTFQSAKTSVIMNTGNKLGFARAWRVDNDTIRVETYDTSFVAANGILDQTPLIIQIIP